jgi:predicted ATP-grasp superfamily ATP-dependent carboligase
VIALGHETDPVRWSRYCAEFVDTGAGEASQQRWREWLERGSGGGVVLACNDDALELTITARADLEGLGYRLIEADDSAVAAMLDKERGYEIARAAGVPAPRTVTLSDGSDLEGAAESIGFPCAVKPLRSHRFAQHVGLSTKVLLAGDQAELRDAWGRFRELGVDALVTEIVPGGDELFASFYTYLDQDGEPLFRLTKRKLRQYPIHFGLGTYHLTDWNPAVAEAGLRFLQAAGVRGLACVEFKRDPRTDDLVLIECNHRFTAATELLRAAGADLPLFTYNRLLGRSTPPMDRYRPGAALWVPRTDIRSLRAYRHAHELTAGKWLASLGAVKRLPVASIRDPGPLAGSVVQKLRRLGSRLTGRPR